MSSDDVDDWGDDVWLDEEEPVRRRRAPGTIAVVILVTSALLAAILWPVLQFGVPAASSLLDDARESFARRDCRGISEDERSDANLALLDGITEPPGAVETETANELVSCSRSSDDDSSADYVTVIRGRTVAGDSYSVLEHYRREFVGRGWGAGCFQGPVHNGANWLRSAHLTRGGDSVRIDGNATHYAIALDAGPLPPNAPRGHPLEWNCTPGTPPV